jgi:hypothetical protein
VIHVYASVYIASGREICPEAKENAKVARGCCSHIGSFGCSDGFAELYSPSVWELSAGFGSLGWISDTARPVAEGSALGWFSDTAGSLG